jgi:fructokinase
VQQNYEIARGVVGSMFDVVALGELLIDFTPCGLSSSRSRIFEQNPGGAPANVLAALAKLNKKSAFIGMVGQDQFGLFLKDVLQKNGIDIRGLKFSKTVNTTLAFVHLTSSGDRSFSFYRNPGADMMLCPDDIDYDLIKQAKVFHFGSISMTDEPSRSATLAAIRFAKEKGIMISYDPNYRPPLWSSEILAVSVMKSGLEYADILKVSETELELLTGTANLEKGSIILYEMGVQVILVTLGAEGCYYRYSGGTGHVPTFQVQVVDTTGAGDAFLGGVLYYLSGLTLGEIQVLNQNEFEKIITFANAVGALTTTQKGAIPALPDMETVGRLIDGLNSQGV